MTLFPAVHQIENYLFKRNGKYPVIGITISLVHLVYLFFFQRIGIFEMVIYNIISVCGYIYFSAEAYKGNRIKSFYIFLVFEIPLHALMSTLYLGWNYRFMLVLMGAISILYYFIIFIDSFNKRILIPTVISIIYMVAYVAMRIYCEFNAPLKQNIRYNASYESFFTYFNTIAAWICIIFFCVLNSIEYNYIRNRMLSENTKLDTYATYDPLTNLLNRRSTDVKLRSLFDSHYHDEDAFSIIMCDIDRFKSVNDTYGHDAGDYVLKEVAWILKDTVRDNDIVSRWGGEEFLIIVSSSKANAAILAERIRAQIEAHTYSYKNIDLHVTITLGVSSYHANTDIESLIKSADQKLYRGKENGRNQVVV